MLALADADMAAAVARLTEYRSFAMVSFAASVLPADGELRLMLAGCRNGAATAAALVAGIDPARRRVALRGLVWLVKMGILIVPQ